MEWKEVQLCDTCDLIAGYAFKSKDFGDYPSKVLKIADINPPFVSSENSSGVDLSKYDLSKLDKYIVKKGDYLLAMTGATIGKLGRYISEEQAYLNQRVLKFNPHKSIDPDFLYYVLCGRVFPKYVMNHIDSESAQPNISAGTIGKFVFQLPDIETQRRIASILSSLDDKIAINRRICENLEAQAQALFKHWFIDFAPFKNGKFVESELGMIPEGWRVGTLGEIAEIIKPSIKPQNDVEYSHYSIPAFDNKKMPSCDNGGTIKSNKFMIQDSVTLLSKLNPDHKRIWFVNKVKANAICSTEFIPFYAKERRHSAFIYCYLNSWQNYREIANGAKGTTNSHQRIDANAILSRKIAYDKETINKFCDLVGELLEQENIAIQESSRLSALRDTLLPKLMSGEIKV